MTESYGCAWAPLLPRLPPWGAAWLHLAGTAVGRALYAVARHTGIPITVVAAVALVVSFRVARRASRFALEVALAVALVVAATRAGWLRF